MCRNSLEGYAHFQAQDGDKIVVRGVGHKRGFYGDKPATAGRRVAVPGKVLACVLVGQKLTLSDMQFQWPRAAYRWIGRGYERADLSTYTGKEVVVEVANMRDPERLGARSEADSIRFPCGGIIEFPYLACGVEGVVGVKPSLDEKLGLTTMAQVAGDNIADPDPKPPEEQPKEPADQPADAPQREPREAVAGDD